MKARWIDKLKRPHYPEIKEAPENWATKYGGSRMLIPTPMIMQEAIYKIPEGSLVTISILRQYLKAFFSVDFVCPLTSGIFTRIVAEAAEEARELGKVDIAPYWRVIKEDGSIYEKWPGGLAYQISLLKNEGHEIMNIGKKLKIDHFQYKLIHDLEEVWV